MTLTLNWKYQSPIYKLAKTAQKRLPKRQRNIRILLVLCALSLIALSGCAETGNASLSYPPQDLMSSCSEDNLYDLMLAELDGAEGLNEIWLAEYAATARDCQMKLEGLQEWAR